ncbi:type II toxin-antitoxin system PemK/MazF family toxin [Gemmatimonas sp.]|jgi:mRNA-degrading endonuclease toxin of MazEF toxin-antitoxin module|uniref:type II toxin-antitoxin system PemK/MazF family toxin n=1 Tax=Gemmatimonas sp. TaxID=1962908 RepID=UPI0022C49CDB|nr:type II toxin-antitoxin system PemK/MazF family toxin [Gemmatimonas sp.]MCA2982724.1 type II toxin-antitoxin system PemK/MazF family toxin [Gemmatimonas sp.]MCE2954955.1 type II toxin-antitoxin system PemK/MazF family toxin [Gemmatimonas sp.]MCZ8012964.1 type II toxin-antitoxin system PemK/MazF family toxin [Gemmatimonas sp.]MCZ8268339.1 type II toxin-antitoxin system PemK/MazF family toxin [Gemmatimonas sp.]
MAYTGRVRRWELFEADLDHPVGSEQGGAKRPVLIVSNDGFNAAFPIVTVVPLTKQADKQRTVYPFEVLLPSGVAGNPLDSIAMPQQLRTISKKRLLAAPLGALTDSTLQQEIEDKLLLHLDIALEVVDDEDQADEATDEQ